MNVAITVLIVVAAVASTNASALPRVYVAPINGPADVRDAARLLEDRVLVAAKSAGAGFDVVGARDVQGLLDVEAAKAAVGCDSDSCSDEVAGALNADELVTGQLGHIGSTWQLSLSRSERKTLRVLGRSSRTSHGDTPEGLLSDVPSMVAEIFGTEAPGPSALFVTGAVTTSIGALAFLTGAACYGASWLEYENANSALSASPPDVKTAAKARDTGVALVPYAYLVGGAGLVVAAIGGALLAVDAGSSP